METTNLEHNLGSFFNYPNLNLKKFAISLAEEGALKSNERHLAVQPNHEMAGVRKQICKQFFNFFQFFQFLFENSDNSDSVF